MKLVENWREAPRWISMRVFAFLTVLPVVWVGLPDDIKNRIPDSWDKWIFLIIAGAAAFGGVGRVVDQNTGAK